MTSPCFVTYRPYDVLLMFFIDFVLLNSNRMIVSLKCFVHFGKFKVKGEFQGQI